MPCYMSPIRKSFMGAIAEKVSPRLVHGESVLTLSLPSYESPMYTKSTLRDKTRDETNANRLYSLMTPFDITV